MGSRIIILLLSLAAALLSACDDGDKPPADAPVVTDGAMCAGTTAYLGTCATDDECTSCICRSFGHSKVCTKSCTGPADCPAPSGGCSNGFCRP